VKKSIVSVIMSVYNEKLYLRESIESILAQTFADFEFIIIDDGSNDCTWQILIEYANRDTRVKLVKNNNNIGLTKSLNKGLKLAQGEYIARIDGNDISLPERLEIEVEHLHDHNNIGLLGTAYYLMNSKGQFTDIHYPPQTDTEIRWRMLFDNAFCNSTIIFRRKLLDFTDGFYDETIVYAQDYDLWFRLLKHTRATNLSIPLVGYRILESGISRHKRYEQMLFSSAIRVRQLNTLIPKYQFTQFELDTLQHWYYNMLPSQLNQQELRLCRVILRIIRAFKKQQNIYFEFTHAIRKQWVNQIISVLSLRWQREWRWLRFGLLLDLLWEDPSTVLKNISGRFLRRTRRIISS
jgi:glycosyltransferase involved in cell wall biosynthesis